MDKPKPGTEFEKLVADIICEMDPHVAVRQGEWVDGPDGRRELDVHIIDSSGEKPIQVYIECKDYNPDRGKIGIAVVDALDSKRKDLQIDVTFLCSNAGFTDGAVNKAKRVGIGLIGVLKEDDTRTHYCVTDEIYIRRLDLDLKNWSFKINSDKPKIDGEVPLDKILFENQPVVNWAAQKMVEYIAHNPVVNGTPSRLLTFTKPLDFVLPNGIISATSIKVSVPISGSWYSKIVEFDASGGFYDWVRKAIKVGLGAGSIALKNVPFGEGGKAINCPPDLEFFAPGNLDSGEVKTWLIDIGGFSLPENFPQLDRFVIPEDLDPIDSKLSPELCYSNAPY